MSSTTDMSGFIYFTTQYHRFIPPTIFCFGIIGNILSLITFSRQRLRKNPCVIYFLGLAITNLNNLIFGLLLNYLIDAHGIDLITPTLVFCRLRFFILHCSNVLSSWFVVMAGIDRLCISSRNAHRRNFSSLKHARIVVGLATLICSILYSHVLGLFTIDQTKSSPVCNAQSGTYRIFYDFLYFTTFSFIPPILMIIVGLATFHNTIRAHEQIGPIITTNHTVASSTANIHHLRKRDRQFIKMLLIQLISTVVLTLPIAIQKLYSTFTQNITKGTDRVLIETFFGQFVRTLTHINNALSFYLYTLSGSAFRREFCELLCRILGFIFGIDSHIHRRFQQMIGFNTTPAGTIDNHSGVTKKHTRLIQHE